MADNTIGWGQGSVNNTNDWGKGKANSTNDWGSIYANSPSGDTNIEGGSAVNPDLFIIQVQTDNTGTSADDQFTLPMVSGTYDVDWGDGNIDTSVSGTQTHTYASAGTYDISVTATTGYIRFDNTGDKLKLLDIKQWGNIAWTNFISAFRGCSNLTGTATDIPDLSSVTSFSRAFLASGFNGSVSGWDTSGITSFFGMFVATPFNQDVSGWDTSSVTDMTNMFEIATAFDQDISSWDINQVTQFGINFMRGVTLSTANYDALLIAWDAQGTMSFSGTVNFGSSQYTLGGAAEAARTSLISKWGGITDGGGV